MAKWCPITKSYVVYLACQECEYKNKNCKEDKKENKEGK